MTVTVIDAFEIGLELDAAPYVVRISNVTFLCDDYRQMLCWQRMENDALQALSVCFRPERDLLVGMRYEAGSGTSSTFGQAEAEEVVWVESGWVVSLYHRAWKSKAEGDVRLNPLPLL